MIKLLLLCLCACAALGNPVQYPTFQVYTDVENDAEIIDAADPLPGTRNLNEKKVPFVRLTVPAGYLGYLWGNRNLAERAQLPYEPEYPVYIPGNRNLAEKAIPEAVIARMTAAGQRNARNPFLNGAEARHPKSEVEKVAV